MFDNFRSFPPPSSDDESANLSYKQDNGLDCESHEFDTPTPTCFGRSRSSKPKQQNLFVTPDNSTMDGYRVGSSNSLPPIQKEEVMRF